MKQALLEELAVSEGLVSEGYEVIPRFRVFTPDGEFVVLLPLAGDAAERSRRIRLMGQFLAWKMATAFIISGEVRQPASISSFFVSRNERLGLMRAIEREPAVSFGRIIELSEAHIDEGLTALLPRRETTMTLELIAELERVFGDDGEIPAVRLS